jgi:hypothetical protein
MAFELTELRRDVQAMKRAFYTFAFSVVLAAVAFAFQSSLSSGKANGMPERIIRKRLFLATVGMSVCVVSAFALAAYSFSVAHSNAQDIRQRASTRPTRSLPRPEQLQHGAPPDPRPSPNAREEGQEHSAEGAVTERRVLRAGALICPFARLRPDHSSRAVKESA